MPPRDLKVMSFGDHLEDLRKRLIWALVAPIPIFALALVFGGGILAVLVRPLKNQLEAAGQGSDLLATNVLEPFTSYLLVAFIITLLVSMPWVIVQLWLFIAPGLHHYERRMVYFLIPLSGLLTIVAMAFLYYLMLPVSLFFLIGFGTDLISEDPGAAVMPPGVIAPTIPVLPGDPPLADLVVGQQWINERLNELRVKVDEDTIAGVGLSAGGLIEIKPRIGEYIKMIFWLGLVFALAFQLPLVLMLLGWVGILRPEDLTRFRRQVILVCAIAGALLTPQDPFSMVLMAGALYLLFEFGILLMRTVTPARIMGTDGAEGDA